MPTVFVLSYKETGAILFAGVSYKAVKQYMDFAGWKETPNGFISDSSPLTVLVTAVDLIKEVNTNV